MNVLKSRLRMFHFIGASILILASLNSLYGSTSRTFTYSLENVSFDTLDGYDVVKMPAAPRIQDLGEPSLPYYHYNFIIQNNQDVTSVQITASDCDTLEGAYCIYPAQIPTRPIIPPDDPPFTEPDSAIYNSSNDYPGILAQCSGMGFFDGANKIAQIAVYPLQFMPADSILIFYTSISINLEFGSSS